MSPLPSSRCTPSRALPHVGVDYAGPYSVRMSHGRGSKSHKAYIAVFVCFSTRACHLKLVSDYSSQAFLAAFKRFTARQGYPDTIYSDLGTTFKGAHSELQRELELALRDEQFRGELSTKEIEWKFTPPAASYQGRLWEAAVKSLKFHIRRVMGEFLPTFEEMTTTLCLVEACLNSRPLTRNGDDLDDLALTPGHFLIGASLNATPSRSVLDEKVGLLTGLQSVTRVVQSYWKAWQGLYLSAIQARNKWREVTPAFCHGDIVLVRNPNTAPGNSALGKVVELRPSKDGLVRTVQVQIKNSILERPVTQICRLPVD